jgi:hypothetical protein
MDLRSGERRDGFHRLVSISSKAVRRVIMASSKGALVVESISST